MPTPRERITILSLIANFVRTALGKCTMTCSEKRPDLPVTTPLAPLPSPLITTASLPTQAKMFSPRLPFSDGNAMLTPGCTQSASHP
jgi:hypothetical protein